MAKIFISYRRTDTAEMSRRIYDELIKHTHKKNVFRDIDTLIKGHDFRAGIERFVLRSDVMLVLIGDDWLTIRDTETGEYRLHNPEDFVRIEVDMGLRHIQTIIPVLVNGASMPTETQLPLRLSGLAFINAVNVRDDRFDEDFQVLLNAIGIRRSYVKWVLGLVGIITVIVLGFMALNGVNNTPTTPTNDAAQIVLGITDEPTATPDINPDDARATGVVEAYETLTALAPTDTPTITPTPTDTPISSSDIQLTARAEVFATETSVSQTQAVIAQATQNAVLTEQFRAGATLTQSFQLSLTPLPTNTPIPTNTYTLTPIPSPTVTLTPEPTATSSLVLDIPEVAFTPVARNRDWTPIEREFDGVPMVLVPVGCFRMGNDPDSYYWNGSRWIEGVPDGGEQCFDKPFWMDKTEVTQADFIRLGGVKAYDNHFSGDNRPVERITWYEAQAFCELRGGRLPTEREWEYAARGVENWVYPWGDEWNANNAVYGENSNRQTADVGSRPSGASWVGADDMAGNVWEWTLSLNRNYPYQSDDGREDISASGERVLRGGSWFGDDSDSLRAPRRDLDNPNFGFFIFGVRCVLFS